MIMKAMWVQIEHARYELLTLPILLAGCTTWSVEVIFQLEWRSLRGSRLEKRC
jgi:hypothetical protein